MKLRKALLKVVKWVLITIVVLALLVTIVVMIMDPGMKISMSDFQTDSPMTAILLTALTALFHITMATLWGVSFTILALLVVWTFLRILRPEYATNMLAAFKEAW